MPLLLEDDVSKGGTGFDLQTATTLFWKPVPVMLRQHDREDQLEELTFRILTGVSRHNHNLRILRIHISSDNDLFFLHSLEVSEEDFQSLKSDQGILVDFSSFPGKIISLLEKCTAVQSTDSPRFQAVLTVRGGESIFKVMETNDFKQLPHITLSFRPGHDAAVKQFLAFRLMEIKATCQELMEELQKTKSERDVHSDQLGSLRQQLSDMKEQYDKHVLEVHANTKTQRAALLEDSSREKAALKDQFERERRELEKKLQDQMSALNSRLAELDTENRKLRDAKYELDTKVSELSHKLGTAEGSNRSLEEDNSRLRAQNQQLSAEKHEREIQLNEAKAKVLALEDKLQAQSEIFEQQKSRIRDLEASLRQLDSRCGELKDTAAASEQRAKEAQAEVLKGNQIIEKLSNDVKVGKEKLKRKQAIIVRQEEELQQRDQALGSATRDVQGLSQTLEHVKLECSSLRAENLELKAKLEDSKQQLQSNEQMIRWLNQQVTEAQLQVSGSIPGSRYTFRPALMAGPSSATAALPSSSAAQPAATPAGGLLTAPGIPYTSKYSSAIGSSAPATAAKPYTPASPSRAGPSYNRAQELLATQPVPALHTSSSLSAVTAGMQDMTPQPIGTGHSSYSITARRL